MNEHTDTLLTEIIIATLGTHAERLTYKSRLEAGTIWDHHRNMVDHIRRMDAEARAYAMLREIIRKARDPESVYHIYTEDSARFDSHQFTADLEAVVREVEAE